MSVVWNFNPYTSLESQQFSFPLQNNSSIQVNVTTIYDAATRISSDHYDASLVHNGILPSSLSLRSTRYKEIHNVLYRLFLNPSFELCQIINSYTSQFWGKYSIGIQIRMGGKMSNTNDAVFMNMTKLSQVIMNINKRIVSMNSTNVILFVSTDSQYAMNYIHSSFNHTEVLSVKEYSIGHSATAIGERGN